MTARLASPESFSQAGVDYPQALRDLRFVVEKRGNGQPVIKVSSLRPVNEPFLDMLVELNWPAGRLVREYTFLLDPPEMLAKGAVGPVSVAEAKVIETIPGGNAALNRAPTPVKAQPQVRQAPAAKPVAESRKAEPADSRVVQSGDTLRKIASETKYEGVSLEQMLVGLFQNNPDAFIGKNINRLKAGAILGIPEKSAVEAVSDAEAKKVYVTQSTDWNAYRQKLAAATAKAPAREESASQQGVTGKITAKVEDKATPAEQSKDQVKVSRTELPAKGAANGKAAASEADLIAKDKALQEAQGRLASLEKNVGELQKLLELKTQKLAELQQAGSKKEEAKPAEPVKAVEPPKPVEVAKPVEPVKEEVKPVEVVKPAEEAKPEEAPKPVAEKPVEAPKPPEPKPVVAPEPEPEEPGFIDALAENPLTLVGGGGILALLAAYFLAKRRRQPVVSPETTTAPSPSSLGPNSVFRMTGGQSIDTGNTAPQTGDFSQTGPGSIDTDEVDPVAEADVYMAYGRDTQAEEILLEALQKDPQRTAIHAKLLEIYANRKSLKQFETLASELYAQTGGVGPEWEKVSELGASLDPANPLYSGGHAAEPSAFDADATMIVTPEALARDVPPELELPAVMALDEPADEPVPDALVLSVPVVEPQAEVVAEEAQPDTVDDEMSLDFDIGLPVVETVGAATPEEVPVVAEAPVFEEPYVDTVVTGEPNALDFDLGADAAAAAETAAAAEPVVANEPMLAEDANFGFDLGAEPATEEIDAQEVADASPDFSPEGTMVMPSGMDEDAAVSTFVGVDGSPAAFMTEPPEPEPVEPPMADFAFDIGSSATQTIVNPMIDEELAAAAQEFAQSPARIEIDNPELTATTVGSDADSLEFDVKLTDSVFLGQPMIPPEFDIGSIDLDLSAEPSPAPLEAAAPAAELEAEEDVAKDSHWEQVNTKLDLAKAYEEMGDLEGARELLQEVVGEGSADLVEQARAILGRIGE
ncbi:hypothetical protein KIG99_05755 [Quatrionicoccus australiensis]|uniref:FimV/HubP family polar landmark protein n=1 Tax=Quatrionicoccus australiensis TaxID=138118 RepID=UPI001CFA1DE2|nr:FimV/HubP family polar landmark protein [Quatrionicoccus australiensis]MCB4359199.1 hypothetical protein [Quatrionicoccus australiensis]